MRITNNFKFILTYFVATAILFLLGGIIYLVTSLIALLIICIIQLSRVRVMKITRWAHANTGKAQVLITVLQLILLVIGIMAGYNFKKLGVEFSNSTVFIFGSILFISFLSIHFFPKRRLIALPYDVNKNRLIYISIALSSFVLMVITGNRIEEKYPDSTIANTVKGLDNLIFPGEALLYADLQYLDNEANNNTFEIAPATLGNAKFASHLFYEKVTPPEVLKKELLLKLKAEKKAEKQIKKKKARQIKFIEKHRKLLAAGLTAGAIILIILLGILTCAGICLIIGGFSGSAWLIPLGVIVAGGSIYGIVKVSQSSKKTSTENNK